MINLRSDMLRIASELPLGDSTRRKLLATLREAAPDYDWWDRNGRKFKSKTTRAIRLVQKDPKKALQMAEELFADMEAHGYPDNWHRVNILKEDAEHELRMKNDRWASEKSAAGVYSEMIWKLIDKRDFHATFSGLQKTDQASADLLRQVMQKLMDAFDLSRGEAEAMNRLSQVVKNHGRWDGALMRNNIFKAANSLGISLPHGMF
jgi:Txe/YoeB family toxin of Txe-Axe toxin-antitoxin module